jgi:hypothetical protein
MGMILQVFMLRKICPKLVQRLQYSALATTNYDSRAWSALDLQLLSNLLQLFLDLGGPFFCSGDDCFDFFT